MKEIKKWMPMFWGEYFAKTRHLSCEEHGAYLQLIGYYWLKGSLPTEDRQLSRIVGLHLRDWRRISGSLSAFFNPDWTHDRIDTELAYAIEKSKRLSANAKLRLSKGRPSATPSADTPTPTPTEVRKEVSKRSATLLPDDWKPNLQHQLFGSKLGLSPSEFEDAVGEMRDWSLGNGERRLDWDRVFSNWMRRNAKGKRHGQHVQKSSSSASEAARALRQRLTGHSDSEPGGNIIELLPEKRRD